MASAHFLRGYEGKCKNLHGHTWRIEVAVANDTLNELGMVADFGVLKKELNELIDTMDHAALNEQTYFQSHNPTTENIARYIYRKYAEKVAPLKVCKVQVWESDTSGVTYYE
jgi:6-pyruvoyltetrahydropterin/6-carboxytetrahydropterin synthase